MKTWLVLTALTATGLSFAQPCEAGFRRFDHPLLATEAVCVPDDPARVVVADFAAFDVM